MYKVMLEQEPAYWAAVGRREIALAGIKKATTWEAQETLQRIVGEGGMAISALTERYDPLVKHAIKTMALNFSPVITPDDHYQNGRLGLLQAIRRFNPRAGVKFSTYATPRIRGAMRDNERNTSPVSRRFIEYRDLIERATNTFIQNHETEPTEEELLRECRAEDPSLKTVEQLREAQQIRQFTTISLDELLDDEKGGKSQSVGDFIADDAVVPPEHAVIRSEENERLIAATRTLPQREQRIIYLYYVREMTMREISSILGVSETRVVQLHRRLIENLRSQLVTTDDANQAARGNGKTVDEKEADGATSIFVMG